jgi:hypothetical protein
MRHHRAMIDSGNTRDPLLMVLEAVKECTSTMRRLVSTMESAESGIGREPRTGDRPLPAGTTAWVTAEHVVHAVDCSRSTPRTTMRYVNEAQTFEGVSFGEPFPTIPLGLLSNFGSNNGFEPSIHAGTPAFPAEMPCPQRAAQG